MTDGGHIPLASEHEQSKRAGRARWRLSGTWISVALFHLVGWGSLLLVAGPTGSQGGHAAIGIGLGLTAYLLGVRHAFDADHIAAIDNTTRKLMQEDRDPSAVGLWFSCGHSTVVFLMTLALALGIRTIAEPVLDENSEVHRAAGLIGTLVSSGFLYAIAVVNLVVLTQIWTALRQTRAGHFDEASLERQLAGRGLLNRIIGKHLKIITQPWQMYPLGFLFGLGFDTASEIALLAMTASGVASGLPWYAVLCLPVLFAAGMSLFDSLDGAVMIVAYRWALEKPMRKLYYNFAITGLSVAVAVAIGTVELVALLSERLDMQDPISRWAEAIDLNTLGFVVVGLFIATWAIWVAVWQLRRAIPVHEMGEVASRE